MDKLSSMKLVLVPQKLGTADLSNDNFSNIALIVDQFPLCIFKIFSNCQSLDLFSLLEEALQDYQMCWLSCLSAHHLSLPNCCIHLPLNNS